MVRQGKNHQSCATDNQWQLKYQVEMNKYVG